MSKTTFAIVSLIVLVGVFFGGVIIHSSYLTAMSRKVEDYSHIGKVVEAWNVPPANNRLYTSTDFSFTFPTWGERWDQVPTSENIEDRRMLEYAHR